MVEDCVSVPSRRAEEALGLLREAGLLDRNRKARAVGERVNIPVTSKEEALKLLESQGLASGDCTGEPPPRRSVVDLSELREKAESLGLWRHSYHQVGDILVFNAKREEELPALREIAGFFLQKLPHARAAYAKLETTGVERTPRLVHLAGERRTRTRVREHGVEIAVDISRAYYNPRLAEEHHRVALEVGDGELVADMFAGVGGFCLHIATLRKATVVCNDVNPHATLLATEGVLANLNRMRGEVYVLNMDARDLPLVFRRLRASRVIMNHPTGSLNYLDTALRIAARDAVVHLYMLLGREKPPEKALPSKLESRFEILAWRRVLDHSPSKHIVRIDLRVLEPL